MSVQGPPVTAFFKPDTVTCDGYDSWSIAFADRLLWDLVRWAEQHQVWMFLKFILPILDDWERICRETPEPFVAYYFRHYSRDDLSYHCDDDTNPVGPELTAKLGAYFTAIATFYPDTDSASSSGAD